MNKTAAPRVLIIDDDADWMRVVAASLESMGVVTETAERPEQAMELLRHEQYDMILLDWYLGNTEASEILPGLREATRGAPIYIVTGRARDIPDAEKVGAGGLLRKGVELATDVGFRLLSLLAEVRRANQQRHLDTLREVGEAMSDAPAP